MGERFTPGDAEQIMLIQQALIGLAGGGGLTSEQFCQLYESLGDPVVAETNLRAIAGGDTPPIEYAAFWYARYNDREDV